MQSINLKNLSTKTAQEVFDYVAQHLLKQNKKSRNEVGVCKYYVDNLRCAAGCLISPFEYNTSMEGQTWDSMVKNGFAPKEHIELIGTLQSVHDACSVQEWKHRLAEVAELYQLSTEAL